MRNRVYSVVNSVLLPLLLVCAALFAGCSEKPITERLHGTWRFDYKATKTFRGEPYTADHIGLEKMLNATTIAIDTQEQTFATKTGQRDDTIEGFRLVSEGKNRIIVQLGGGSDSLELRADGALLYCPILGGTEKCMVFFKKSDNPKDIGELTIAPKAPKTNASAKTEKEAAKPQNTEDPLALTLAPFLVQLNDTDRKRYIKISFELALTSQTAKATINANMPHVRDGVITLLGGKSFAELSTMQGKIALKDAVRAAINTATHEQTVKEAYITDMILQ